MKNTLLLLLFAFSGSLFAEEIPSLCMIRQGESSGWTQVTGNCTLTNDSVTLPGWFSGVTDATRANKELVETVIVSPVPQIMFQREDGLRVLIVPMVPVHHPMQLVEGRKSSMRPSRLFMNDGNLVFTWNFGGE